MAVKKKVAAKAVKTASKKVPTKSKTTKTTVPQKKPVSKTPVPLKPVRLKAKSLYIHTCFFFPLGGDTYTDNYQGGRVAGNGTLQAPILLPVGSTIKSVTVYYKNNTQEDLMVLILKHHIDHHAYSGEIEVSLDSCPPGTLPPDDFLEKFINHFDAGGKILDKYLYFIQIAGTYETASEVRALRGIKIVYTEPA